MKRDGNLTSLWQYKIQDYESSTNNISGEIFDVLIVGGGITGITTALQLQKAGKRCILAEAHTLGFGTTGGTTAHLNTFMDAPYSTIIKNFGEENARLLAQVSRLALDLVKTNVDEYKIDCDHAEKRGFLFSQDEKETKELDEIFDASKKVGCEVSYVSKIPVPVGFIKAMVYEKQAKFHPVKYIQALAKIFETEGGILLLNCLVTDVGEKGDLLQAESSRGKINTRHVIYATHIPPGVNLLHFRCAPYRSYAMGLKLKDHYPEELAYDMEDPYHYYRTHEVNGEKYLIAGGEDHKSGHGENTEECFRRLESYLDKYFDIKEVAFKWSSEYFVPADGLPYIGRLPGSSDNIFVATGFGGNGMTYSHVSAILLTDLITKGYSEYEKLFDPNRIKPVAGFTNFVKEAADVVKKFIGDRISEEKIKELAELAPGEGKVVKYESHSIALYKDENGNLHAVNPVCTHVGCIVNWNNAEQSWDCPCHGSRFGIDGDVLTGPAVKGLEKISLTS